MPWPIFFLILMNLRHRADVCRAAVQRDRDKKSCGRDRVWGQAQHVGDLQRGIIHVWNLYEFNIYTKKYDDSTESLMWWKGGKWSSCHHRSWKEETTVEDSTRSEKRILRWVAYIPSKFQGLPPKIQNPISLFQPTAWKRCSWTTMMKSTRVWRRGR